MELYALLTGGEVISGPRLALDLFLVAAVLVGAVFKVRERMSIRRALRGLPGRARRAAP